MKIAELVANVMRQLSNLPGLSFLQTYVTSANAMKTRFGQRKGDYEAYLASGQNAINNVGEATNSRQRPSTAGGDISDEDTDDETSFYDDYEFEENDQSSTAYRPVDDYPSSDDSHTYYNDDY